jgi:peroxiredoxin Q/BCP
MSLSVGTTAPDFTAKDTNGNTVNLSDFKGKTLILYFYPKDDTPGCTKEAQSFRDAYNEYQSKDIAVLGVSMDDE